MKLETCLLVLAVVSAINAQSKFNDGCFLLLQQFERKKNNLNI